MGATETLAFFMARDGIRQSNLPEIGNQAKVSEVLAGKRKINLRQVRALNEFALYRHLRRDFDKLTHWHTL